MSILDELRGLAAESVRKEKAQKAQASAEWEEALEKEYTDCVNNLHERLRQAAKQGCKSMTAGIFKKGENLHSKYRKDEAFMKKWMYGHPKHEDFLPYITGRLKKAYDEISAMGLNPKLDYWTDWHDSGISIEIKW